MRVFFIWKMLYKIYIVLDRDNGDQNDQHNNAFGNRNFDFIDGLIGKIKSILKI